MITYCANSKGTYFGYLCGRYPNLVGNLYGPGRGFPVYAFAPYALDNGAFPAWTNDTPWCENAWRKLLDAATRQPYAPQWTLVPDVVADKARTIESWYRYYPEVKAAGFIPAFAVQDGMESADVPTDAQVIFIGGTTAWKWQTMEAWCAAFPRVHVGRVNSYGKLLRCFNAGAESTDGTGWFKGRSRELHSLIEFLEFVSSRKQRAHQPDLFGTGNGQNNHGSVGRTVRELAYFRPHNKSRASQQVSQLGGLLELCETI